MNAIWKSGDRDRSRPVTSSFTNISKGTSALIQRLKNSGSNAGEELPCCCTFRDLGAEDLSVDEATYELFQLGPSACRDWRTDHDVALVGVPEEQRFEHRQQHHEESGAFLPGEVFHRF